MCYFVWFNEIIHIILSMWEIVAGKSCGKILLEILEVKSCGTRRRGANLRKAVIAGNLAFGIG